MLDLGSGEFIVRQLMRTLGVCSDQLLYEVCYGILS